MELFILGAIIVFGGGIAIILKKGFNEIIKGMESIDDRLKKIEEKMEK
ncbi:MAG: hypothetical protein AB2L20_21460 [Mangrovibacterium sp.]